MKITYKQFESQHANSVAVLQKQWETENITFGLMADTENEILSYDKEYFYVALDGDSVVGYVTSEAKTNDKDNYMNVFPINTVYIQVNDLYIAPTYRNQNIGAKLLAIIEETANKNNIQHIFLSSATIDTESVRRFYEKNGFKIWTTMFFK